MEEARATKKSVKISNRKKMAEKEEQWQVDNMCFGLFRKFLSESRKKKNNPVCSRRRAYCREKSKEYLSKENNGCFFSEYSIYLYATSQLYCRWELGRRGPPSAPGVTAFFYFAENNNERHHFWIYRSSRLFEMRYFYQCCTGTDVSNDDFSNGTGYISNVSDKSVEGLVFKPAHAYFFCSCLTGLNPLSQSAITASSIYLALIFFLSVSSKCVQNLTICLLYGKVRGWTQMGRQQKMFGSLIFMSNYR